MSRSGYQVSFSRTPGKGQGEPMREAQQVSAMLRLHELGWGVRRIARELGVSKHTVKRYLRQGGWSGYARVARPGVLAAHASWPAERFRRNAGNAEVVRQELQSELGLTVSLRTVERAWAPLRRELAAAARATVRFETGAAVTDRLRHQQF